MRYPVDFSEVSKICILDVCKLLGMDLRKTAMGLQYRGSCPICGSMSSRAFCVTPSMNRFWCHGDCDGGGDCLELYSRVRRISKYEAALELLKQLGGRA